MHIAVDGSVWGGHARGVALSTRRLWSSYLPFLGPAQTTVFAPSTERAWLPSSAFVPIHAWRGAARMLWQQCLLPLHLRRRKVDLLHSPCYTVPAGASCRLIVTVHDLIAWTHPELAGRRNALHLRALVGSSIHRANAVCAPTEAVRRAIIERFAVSPRKVFVVPWGVDSEIEPRPREEAAAFVRERFGVDEPFALFCGCIEPKKNLRTAIRAAHEAGVLLLIAGPVVDASRAILPGNRERCRYLGYVTARELGALYSATEALLFPSFIEGFGLPAVEAMRCGCPVIASEHPVLREVCGGAALHAEHSDVAAFAAHLRRVQSDASLRQALIARGRERAATFTWTAAAEHFARAVRFASL
jgi:glycosyltransferase involved in cell wall biosynthesis